MCYEMVGRKGEGENLHESKFIFFLSFFYSSFFFSFSFSPLWPIVSTRVLALFAGPREICNTRGPRTRDWPKKKSQFLFFTPTRSLVAPPAGLRVWHRAAEHRSHSGIAVVLVIQADLHGKEKQINRQVRNITRSPS